MRVDVHCHWVQYRRPCQPANRFSFEPDTAPHGDAFVPDAMVRGIKYRVLKWLLGLPKQIPRDQLNNVLEQFCLDQILGAREVDRVVVLAFDQYHTIAGEPLGPRVGRSSGSDLYISNTYVRSLWRQHPQRILFGASIHPYRPAAEQMLEEVAQAGAVLVKWLPVNQNIDARDARTIRFLRKAGELRMPMLIHYGGEKALGNPHREFEDPAPLLDTLRELRAEGRMPPVIVAHIASPSLWPFETARTYHTLVRALLGEFADAPLYADISGLAMPNRARWLKKAAAHPYLRQKLVQGSDFPIPATLFAFRRQLGSRYQQVKSSPFWLDRDILLKSALGIGEDVFGRGAEVLRHRIEAADALVARRASSGSE